MIKIIESVEKLLDEVTRARSRKNLRRFHALVYFLRDSGLRIGDAVGCSVGLMADKKLRLYTQKTGQHVHVVLPDFVARVLATVPRCSDRFWFWSGNGQLETATKDWQGRLLELGKKVKISRIHAHRFRDTFAVNLLKDGTPLDRVSILLGHSSTRITEKHYALWLRVRQEQAEADVRRSWQIDTLYKLRATSCAFTNSDQT
jgi:integrase/recombinase XerD